MRARGAGSSSGGGYRGQIELDSMDRSSVQSDRGALMYSGEEGVKVRRK